jgi:hypothetical protein
MTSPGSLARAQTATALVTAAILDDTEAARFLLAEDDEARAVAWHLAHWYARVLQREHEEGGPAPLERLRDHGVKLMTDEDAA